MNDFYIKDFDDDIYLLERLKLSDESAFEYIFQKFYPRLCLYAQSFTNDHLQAEDIAKEAFIRIWKSDKKYDSLTHLKNSLYQSTRQVAINQQLSLKRSLHRQENFINEQPTYEDSPLHQIIYSEVMGELYQAIHQLPEQARSVIIMTYLEGKSNHEVAEEMQISIQTVKNYKQRAIKQLRSLIKPDTLSILMSALKILEKLSSD